MNTSSLYLREVGKKYTLSYKKYFNSKQYNLPSYALDVVTHAFACETSCNINVYYLSNNTLKSHTLPPSNNHTIGEINLAFMGGHYDLITIEQPVMTSNKSCISAKTPEIVTLTDSPRKAVDKLSSVKREFKIENVADNAQQTHASRNLEEEEEIVISSDPESETSEPVEQETRSNVDGDR